MSKKLLIKQHNINFTGNLENTATIFFLLEEIKEATLDFSEETVLVPIVSHAKSTKD